MSRLFLLTTPIVLLLLANCTVSRSVGGAMLKNKAAISGEFPVNPPQWRVITCGTDPRESTMSTLFGNDTAVRYTRRHSEGDYPQGSMLAFVTWRQQDDNRWFGARLPAETTSVEMLTVGVSDTGQPLYSYEEYGGSPLKRITVVETRAKSRAAYLLSQRAAVMP